MVEIPVVAEGNINHDLASKLAPVIDFLALGQEIWKNDNPKIELNEYLLRINS
jgi:thiamine-phosphate pyrophosphorylase